MSALLLDNSRVGIQWMHFTFILLSPLKIFSNIIEWCILSVAGQMPGERAHDRKRNLHLDSNWPSQHHPVGGSFWLPRREVPCHGVCSGDHHGVLFARAFVTLDNSGRGPLWRDSDWYKIHGGRCSGHDPRLGRCPTGYIRNLSCQHYYLIISVLIMFLLSTCMIGWYVTATSSQKIY